MEDKQSLLPGSSFYRILLLFSSLQGFIDRERENETLM
jgi:hypothetical protein